MEVKLLLGPWNKLKIIKIIKKKMTMVIQKFHGLFQQPIAFLMNVIAKLKRIKFN